MLPKILSAFGGQSHIVCLLQNHCQGFGNEDKEDNGKRIGPEQTGFVRGRLLLDSFYIMSVWNELERLTRILCTLGFILTELMTGLIWVLTFILC